MSREEVEDATLQVDFGVEHTLLSEVVGQDAIGEGLEAVGEDGEATEEEESSVDKVV